jgi:hypothetical protein
MLILRELFLLYFFFFYSYFYFSIDEEFMFFIVIFIWFIFFLFLYLKTLQNFFKDNLKYIINEYFFFHNKRNLFLSIVRDQYFDFIILNNLINLIIKNTFFIINKNLNVKIIKYNKKNILLKVERLHLIKLQFKLIYLFYFLHPFITMSKIIFFLIKNENKFIKFFFFKIFLLKKKIELNSIIKKQTLNNKVKEDIVFNIYYKNLRNLKKSKVILNTNFFLNEILSFKLIKLNTQKKKFLYKKKRS